MGRFITRDPLSLKDPTNIYFCQKKAFPVNHYVYCNNNPLALFDPNGEKDCPAGYHKEYDKDKFLGCIILSSPGWLIVTIGAIIAAVAPISPLLKIIGVLSGLGIDQAILDYCINDATNCVKDPCPSK